MALPVMAARTGTGLAAVGGGMIRPQAESSASAASSAPARLIIVTSALVGFVELPIRVA
jgi:hypothetical protein